MAVTSVDDFFKLLEKSSLLSAEQLQAALQQLSGENDPKTVARKLLTDGRLTKWQVLQLLNGRSALTVGPYRLRDALAGDNVARAFRAQHAESGQLVELRLLSRSRVAERSEALEEFVADAEKAADASGRKLLEVHRPDGKDGNCYVVLEEAGSGTPAAAADQASSDKPADATFKKPAVKGTAQPSPQEPASAPAASEARPPKLKPTAKPAESAPAQAESGAAEAKDQAAPATPEDSKVEFKIAGLEAAGPVSGAPADFRIARGRRRKKPAAAPPAKAAADKAAKLAAADKAAKPKAAEAAEGAEGGEGGEGDATANPASTSKRALSPAVLIGGAVGGGVLLVVAVVVAWLMFSGGDSTEVADAGGAKPPVEQAKEAPKEGEAKPAEPGAEAKPAAAEAADPVVADPVVEVQPAMPAVAEAKPEAKAEPAAPGAKPDEMAKTPAAADPAAAKPAEASASPAAEPGKEPAASKPTAEPAKPDATKTETPAKEPAGKQPAAKERAAKEPAAKDAPAKEPAAKEAEKKPPAPPAGKKPFADLKATAALPDVSATDPLVLGPVYVPAAELCFVKLRGGEKARKGSQHLIMKNAKEGLDDKAWEISVRDAGGTETVVALLKLNDQSQLVFQWGPNAKAQELSPYLCNCALSLTCAGESKAVTFREPETVEALAVDLSKPSSKKEWPVKMCPDPEAVRFLITGMQGAKCTVEPAEPVLAKKKEKEAVSVKIEDGGGLLSLKIDFSLTNNFQLTASPYIKLSSEASKPDKFVRRMFENNLKAAQAQSEQFKQRVEFTEKYSKSNAKDAEQAKQRLPVFELDAKNAETLVQNMKKIDDMMKALGEGMKIQFRLYYDADSTEVVLLKSGS